MDVLCDTVAHILECERKYIKLNYMAILSNAALHNNVDLIQFLVCDIKRLSDNDIMKVMHKNIFDLYYENRVEASLYKSVTFVATDDTFYSNIEMLYNYLLNSVKHVFIKARNKRRIHRIAKDAVQEYTAAAGLHSLYNLMYGDDCWSQDSSMQWPPERARAPSLFWLLDIKHIVAYICTKKVHVISFDYDFPHSFIEYGPKFNTELDKLYRLSIRFRVTRPA